MEHGVGTTEQGKSSLFPCSDAPNTGTVETDSSTVRPNLGAVGTGTSLKGANLGTGVPKWITVWSHTHTEISHGRFFAEAG